MAMRSQRSRVRDVAATVVRAGDAPDAGSTTLSPRDAADGDPRAWAWVLDDLTDTFLAVHCPHCGADVPIAVGDYGDHSAIRDRHRGDIDRRPLRPAPAKELSPLGARLLSIATRDGQVSLARGLPYLFGTAQCPPCANPFAIAPAFEKRFASDGEPRLPGT
ncbi:hypothetical protein ACIRL2_45130 [Embleya sp. NPDC127516]|uniref:hypothetical protein n=1 Tax=Embleya sp. NPDC127516 TaxID=3363990 RepID=UPI00380F26DD